MSTYFSLIFKVHYMVFRYNVCFEECMDLSPRSINGTPSKDIKPMRKTKGVGIKIKN